MEAIVFYSLLLFGLSVFSIMRSGSCTGMEAVKEAATMWGFIGYILIVFGFVAVGVYCLGVLIIRVIN